MPKLEPSAVIAEARRWVGTPFRHRHARLDRGVDCVGLVRGVADNLGAISITAEDWRPFELYSRTPNPEKMGEAMAQFLIAAEVSPLDLAPDAHIAWMQWREGLPMHLGFAATFEDRRTIIHATESIGQCVEHDFSDLWRARVHSWWKLPGVAY